MKKYFIRGKVLLGTAIVAGLLVSGCGNSENFVFTNTVAPVVPVPAAPVAVNDARDSLGNATVTYTAANGVLTNDTVNGATISSFDAVGSNGGTVVLNADGSFSYTPVFGFVGSETFNYTLSNADGDSTATVTMTSAGLGFFVDNQAGTTGDGSQADPFDALTDAVAVAGDGDTIFVARGDGSATGLSDDITLPQGVSLIGEGEGLILGQTVVPQGQAPVIDARITVSGDNTISGLTLDNDAAESITGDGFTNLTITNNTFTGEIGDQVNLDNVSGTLTMTGNTFSLADMTGGVEIDAADTGTCTFVLNANTFQLKSPTANSRECFEVTADVDVVATIEINDNFFTGSATGSLGEAIIIDPDDDATVTTLTINGNVATFLDDPFLVVDSNGTVTATISGNTSDQNLHTDPELCLEVANDAIATFIFDNNRITDTDDLALELDVCNDSTCNLALRNNTFEANSGDSVDLDADDDSNFCAEITGNTFNGDLVFDEITTGSYRVEQFGNAMGDVLATLNTFTSGGVRVDNGTVTSIADGDCMIP